MVTKVRIFEEIKAWKLHASIYFYIFLLLGVFLSHTKLLDILTTSDLLFRMALLTAAFFFLWFAMFVAINDYFDYELDKLAGSLRNPIINGKISKNGMLVLLFISTGLGLGFSYLINNIVFLMSVLICFSIYFYSAEPFRFKGKLLVDLVTHSLPGMSLILMGCFAFSEFNPMTILYSSAGFFFYVMICVSQQIRDYEGDKKFGLNTTVITLCIEKSIVLLKAVTFVSLAFLALLMFEISPYLVFTVALMLPWANNIFKINKDNVSDFYSRMDKKSNNLYILAFAAIAVLIYLRII
jgi:4-hydroxybenzoate polyprenyltransferase